MDVRFAGEWVDAQVEQSLVGRPWLVESAMAFDGEQVLDFSVSLNLLNALLHEAWLHGAFGGRFPVAGDGEIAAETMDVRWGFPPVVVPGWRPGAAQLVLQFGAGHLSYLDGAESVLGERTIGLNADLDAVLDGGSIQVLPGRLHWFNVADPASETMAGGGDVDRLEESLWPSLLTQVQTVLRVGFGSVAVDAAVLVAGTDGISDIRMEAAH